MSEQLNGKKHKAWIEFKKLVAMSLLARKLVADYNEGYQFAASLDMSFEELYATVDRTKWMQYIQRDCDEYENDPARKVGQ